jgi:hypothetical protein
MKVGFPILKMINVIYHNNRIKDENPMTYDHLNRCKKAHDKMQQSFMIKQALNTLSTEEM